MKSDLDLVEAYFYDKGTTCGNCRFLHRFREPRGEHFGTPCSEVLSECMALEQGIPESCPMIFELREDNSDE